jgi:hypothetical protein
MKNLKSYAGMNNKNKNKNKLREKGREKGKI